MNKGNLILEQFNNLDMIEPCPGWNQKLMKRLAKKERLHDKSKMNRLILLTVILLLLANLFTLSRGWVLDSRQQRNINLKYIAGDFLISTNSSKY